MRVLLLLVAFIHTCTVPDNVLYAEQQIVSSWTIAEAEFLPVNQWQKKAKPVDDFLAETLQFMADAKVVYRNKSGESYTGSWVLTPIRADKNGFNIENYYLQMNFPDEKATRLQSPITVLAIAERQMQLRLHQRTGHYNLTLEASSSNQP